MDRKEQMERLKKAQQLPHATAEDFKTLPFNVNVEKVNEYLRDYLKPTGTCWHCSKSMLVNWSIQHGETFCVECGTPSRTYHYFKNDKGENVRWEATLQYHPKHFSLPEEETINQ